MRVIVAGSRDIEDAALVDAAIRESGYVPAVVIHGGARGVDTLAGEWAKARDLPVEVYGADWPRYGMSAGPRRNRDMAQHSDADALIAVWNGNESRGTQDMVRQAREVGLPIVLYRVTDGRVWREAGLSRFERNRRRDVPPDLFSQTR